jgi:PAS domain S-box-containing protein
MRGEDNTEQLAIAVERAEDLLRVERDLGIAVSAAGSLEEALDRLLATSCEIEGVDCGGVYIVDSVRRTVDLVAHRGLTDWFVERVSHYGADAPETQLLLKGEPLYYFMSDNRLGDLGIRERENLRAVAVIPVLHDGEVVAALNLGSHTHDELPASTRTALEAIASLVGGVIARRRAEEALREIQRDFQAFFDTLDDFVFVLGPGGRILRTNPAVRERLGYAAEQLSAMDMAGLFPPEQRDEVRAIMARMAEGEVSACLVPLLTGDGRLLPVDTRVTRGKWGADDVLFAVARDITEHRETAQALEETVTKRTAELQAANRALNQEIEERKWSETALKASERKFRAIFDQTFQFIGLMTCDGMLIEANRAALEFGSLEPSDVIGKPFWETPWWTHSKALQARLRDAVKRAARGEFTRFEAFHPGPDGRTRYVDVSIKPVRDEAGNVVLLIPEGRDISEKRAAEEVRLRTEKLQALGVLAGGIAHDFNNLLTGIVTNISLARISSEDPAVLEALADSERAVLRASRLTEQLLTFSKGGTPTKTVASIGDVIRETTTFALSGSNLRCRFDLPDGLWPVEIDAGQIGQVVQNLVINANEAMPAGGVIDVSSRNVCLEADEMPLLPAGRYLCMTIADHGAGIPSDWLPKIFDPYFSTKQSGSGLGLAIAHSIISRHGGHIHVESDLGVGTRFDVFLRASDRDITPKRPTPAEEPTGHGRVLLMDDEGMIRRGASRMLEEVGFQVVTACDGNEAVALCHQAMESGQPFDAVVLDLTVPAGMGGADCIHALKQIDPDVRAIVSSGYFTDPVVAEPGKYGFKGVVRKPYTLEGMVDVLNDVIGG